MVPNRKFLEEYSLYRKFSMDIPDELDFEALNPGQLTADQLLEKPAINMYCPVCESDQTFNMRNEYRYAFNNLALYPLFHPSYGTGVPSNFAPAAHLLYQCALCRQSLRHFMIKFDLANKYVMKVGQDNTAGLTTVRFCSGQRHLHQRLRLLLTRHGDDVEPRGHSRRHTGRAYRVRPKTSSVSDRYA